MHVSLKRSPLFAHVPDDRLLAAARYFAPRHVPAQAPVWYEEQAADEMAVVLDGALTVKVGVQEIGAIAPGELVGESSTFFGDPRVATVVAAQPTELLVIAREALRELRSGHPEVYDRLLDRALEAMARRVKETGRRIALLGNGGLEPPERKPTSALRKLLRAVDGDDGSVAPPILPILRGLPVLSRSSPEVLNRIASALRPRRVKAGEVVFLELEQGDSAFVVVEGAIDVVRTVRGGRARKLSMLTAGSVFGTGSLLLGDRRNASCVATQDGWVRELPRQAHDALRDDAGRAWRESLLAALRFQVKEAGNHLAELKGGTSWGERQKLRLAAARLVAWRKDDRVDDPWTFAGRGAP